MFNKSKVEEMKIDFSQVNSIIYKEYEFLKEHGCKPNELMVNFAFYSSMLSDPEIVREIVCKQDLTKNYRGMNIIIDDSIEEFEVR
jgi:hypothetical protein